MARRPRVIVAGYFVRFPVGGYVWQTLHYLVGLARLGCEVFFYEDTGYYPYAFNPQTGSTGSDYGYGIERLSEVLERFGLAGRWMFWDAERNQYHGRTATETERVFADADVLLNIAGVNRLGDRPRPAARVYLDIDPAFTQIQLENGVGALRDLLAEHNLFFTFGENIGTPACPLPTGGLAWRATRPPIVADFWANSSLPESAPFTTIGKWDASDRDVEFRGERYHWRKSLEWKKFIDLPRRTGERFEVAMDVERVPEDHRLLLAEGWAVRSPNEVSIDPEVYRAYVQSSKGEFTAAKDMNVRLRSGWFSDRSACYLAAGRPAVLQDTGFAAVLPTGKGLFSVRTIEDASEAFQAIASDYPAHCAAARAIAVEYLEASRVLPPLLEAAGW